MSATLDPPAGTFVHEELACGAEFAADLLPDRRTVALTFRVLTGVTDEPAELAGLHAIVERTLAKGTQRFDGRGLADAFDRLGAQWGTAAGRQSMIVRVLCLPEYVLEAIELVAELLVRPTFPDEACRVAVELAQQELRHLEDEPHELVSIMIHRLALGPELGRYLGGTPESLARITPAAVREHWRRCYGAGRLQVAVAGPVEPRGLIARLEECFAGFGDATRQGRDGAPWTWHAAREHRAKELEQQHIALALPGRPRDDPRFAAEQVLLGVLSGGMSGRLFTEVREKQGLVYWVGAWHIQPRRGGVIQLGASTTPQRCRQTYDTLLRELRRLGEDLTEAEVVRARDSLIAQFETEDDLTRARAGSLSDDLFYFGRPVGPGPKLAALRAVDLAAVTAEARALRLDDLCVATLGPATL